MNELRFAVGVIGLAVSLDKLIEFDHVTKVLVYLSVSVISFGILYCMDDKS